MTAHGKAVRMLVLTCFMWALSFPTIKALTMLQSAAVPDAGSWLFSAATMGARFSLAAMITAAGAMVLRGGLRVVRSELVQGAGIGVFSGLGMLLQVDGLAHTQASTSAFLTQGTVLFIPLVKWVWQRQRPGALEGACCLLALVGIAVLAQFDWGTFRIGRGEAETLAGAALFTGHILMLEAPVFRSNDAVKVSVVMFAVIAALCIPLTFLIGPGAGGAWRSFSSPSSWCLLAVLVGPCTLLAYLWMNHWQPRVSAITAGLIYCLEPVFTSLVALVLPGWLSELTGVGYANETITRTLLIGGGLILAANVLMIAGTKPPAALNEHGV